jgi:hypothetical protein
LDQRGIFNTKGISSRIAIQPDNRAGLLAATIRSPRKLGLQGALSVPDKDFSLHRYDDSDGFLYIRQRTET